MDTNTGKAIEAVSTAVAISAVIICVAYFVVVVWWAGYVSASAERELARHENCYQEWSFNEAHQKHWLRTAYCGETVGLNPER